MLRFCFIFLAMLLSSQSAQARPVSLQCPDRSEMTYFFTFDLDTGKAVVKSAGGNLLDGTITASDPGRIAFTLSRGDPPDFDLVWDESTRTLAWIAIPNIPERSRGFKSVCTIMSPTDK